MPDKSHGSRGTQLLSENVVQRRKGAGKKQSSLSLPSDLLPVTGQHWNPEDASVEVSLLGHRIG